MKKTESVAEFLARGGQIKRVPAQQPIIKNDSIKSSTNGGPATIMSMDEADLYYGEQKKSRAKKKATSAIDISALPEELRKKYVDTVIYGSDNQEEDEED